MAIKLKVSETNATLKVNTDGAVRFKTETGIPIYPEEYTGSYEVTPSESEQTLETNGLMMGDDVTVHAMPAGTEGTPTATKGTVSNHSVTVTPSVTNSAGYISGGTKTGTAVSVSASELVSGTYTVDSSGTKDVTNYASASVPAGTAGTPALTVSAVENHSKTIRSSVINQTGWITGGTVSGASTTVSASDLVSGSETKTANGTYDVTNLAEVVVDVSSSQPTLTKYAIRPDATLVQRYTYDKYLHADESITIPGYSTSAQTIKASSSIGSITLDRDNYYYYIVERMLTIPTYSVTTHNKGRCEYHMGVHAFEVIDIPGSSFHSLIEPTRYYTSRLNTVSTVMSSYREVYYSGTSTLTTYSTQAYGVCQAATAPTISSGTLTINSPTVTERGSTSYFVSTYANAVTDIRAQYVIEVYKAPKNNLNYDGWSNDQLMKQVIDGINSSTQTLT